MTFPSSPDPGPGRGQGRNQGPAAPGPRRTPPGPRHRPRLILFAVAALLLLVAIGLVIETAVGPKEKVNLTPPTPIPVPTGSNSAASATSAPAASLTGPIQIIQGSQLVNGVYLGFPHSTQGAVSAAEEFMSQIGSTLDPDRAAAVLRLTADPSYPKAPSDFAHGTISERKDLGLPASGQVPQAASVVLDPVEYQVRDVTPGQVTVLLLADDIITLPTNGTRTRVGVYPLHMHWTEDDWKILPPAPRTSYSKLSAVPGTPQAASDGWQVMTP
jgi:hypothetical protein